jgi:hypothetical protein
MSLSNSLRATAAERSTGASGNAIRKVNSGERAVSV